MSQEVSLPIPQYPPFTLRSSLIDKDPVIWVHILEGYISLFHYLMEGNFQFLNLKSKQLLYQFLKSYLKETYGEENKIFSLGSINVDIQNNEKQLKQLVFHTIKLYSLLKFNLIGESIWHFIGIYINKNNSTVRGLLDGTFKSKFNDNKKSGNISSIKSVQGYIEKSLMNGKFTQSDMQTLSALLGQSVNSGKTTFSLSGNQKTEKAVNKKKSIEFAEKFVTSDWIEILERNYANGKGIHANFARDIMVVSVISLPATQLAKLAKSMDISSPSSLKSSPLFGSLIISEELEGLISGLYEKIRHLIPSDDSFDVQSSLIEPSQEDINNLTAIFPDLGDDKAKVILRQHDNNVELVINKLLENPSLIDEIRLPEPAPSKKKPLKTVSVQPSAKANNRFREENFEAFNSKSKRNIKINSIDEKLKETTLKLALSSLEEGDEPELELYGQFEEYFQKKKRTGGKEHDDTESREPSEPTKPAKQNNNDYLYSVYQSEGIKPFTPEYRGKTLREHIKEHTGWSDNLIEDWGKIMELSTSKHGEIPPPNTNANKNQKKDKALSKRDQKYNESHKASRANHNRKAAHGKKSKMEIG